MLKNNLIEFGKTGEKPLAKSLNILKSSTQISEFYSTSKLNIFATDMLTRSFYFYNQKFNKFKDTELKTLKDFFEKEMNEEIDFIISRFFVSHLKGVKLGYYSDEESRLFDIASDICRNLSKNGWVAFKDIVAFCSYRDYKISFTSSNFGQYYLQCDSSEDENEDDYDYYHSYYNNRYYADSYYKEVFFDPVLKGMFFYLASLGVLELKYNDPISNSDIKAKGKPYISTWDGLEYIKITDLGLYLFGLTDSYTQEKMVKKESKLKFDEYKPIITVDKSDIVMLAKLDPFVEKYDNNRFILSYSKIFKDCKNSKALELKIASFYKNIEPNPPKVFIKYFDEIMEKANILKRDLKQIVIDIKNDKKLLNLFMTNKKIQEIIIKAEGFRILVLKDNLPKLTKIVKDSGFFVDF
jgi:hypothetical protein